jgi:putative copper export protein
MSLILLIVVVGTIMAALAAELGRPVRRAALIARGCRALAVTVALVGIAAAAFDLLQTKRMLSAPGLTEFERGRIWKHALVEASYGAAAAFVLGVAAFAIARRALRRTRVPPA